ncbi:hypothetical protein QN277_022970 [Acacia crassicarpa]|uniref:Uncharacterized protein n=1 Tax=Acacia crassicarpa TaxID=499986 RepID=A0AAE1JGA2_9FABA|nr:hypothetical protein QN277_022970 [Acacia crassicarpa]
MVLSLRVELSAMADEVSEAELEQLEANMKKANEFVEGTKGWFDRMEGLMEAILQLLDKLDRKVNLSGTGSQSGLKVGSSSYAVPAVHNPQSGSGDEPPSSQSPSMRDTPPPPTRDSEQRVVIADFAPSEVDEELAVLECPIFNLLDFDRCEYEMPTDCPSSNSTEIVSMAPLRSDSGFIANSFSTPATEDDYGESTDVIIESQKPVLAPKSDVFTDLFHPLPLITVSEKWILNDLTIPDIVLLADHDLDYYHRIDHGLVHCVAFDPGIPILPNLFKHCSLQASQFFWFIDYGEFSCQGIKLSTSPDQWPRFFTELFFPLIFDPGPIIFCHVSLPIRLVDTGQVKGDCCLDLVAEVYQLPPILACCCISPGFSTIVFDPGDVITDKSLRYVDAIIFPVELVSILLRGVVEMHILCLVNCLIDHSTLRVEIHDSYLRVPTLLSPFLRNFDYEHDIDNFLRTDNMTFVDVMTLCAILVATQVLIISCPFWKHNQIFCMKLYIVNIKMVEWYCISKSSFGSLQIDEPSHGHDFCYTISFVDNSYSINICYLMFVGQAVPSMILVKDSYADLFWHMKIKLQLILVLCFYEWRSKYKFLIVQNAGLSVYAFMMLIFNSVKQLFPSEMEINQGKDIIYEYVLLHHYSFKPSKSLDQTLKRDVGCLGLAQQFNVITKLLLQFGLLNGYFFWFYKFWPMKSLDVYQPQQCFLLVGVTKQYRVAMDVSMNMGYLYNDIAPIHVVLHMYALMIIGMVRESNCLEVTWSQYHPMTFLPNVLAHLTLAEGDFPSYISSYLDWSGCLFVRWNGLDPPPCIAWSAFQVNFSNLDLEDKVHFNGGGNVMFMKHWATIKPK